jgi:hypothetical protein
MTRQKTKTRPTPRPSGGGVAKPRVPEPRLGLRSRAPSRAQSEPTVPVVPRVHAGSTLPKPWARPTAPANRPSEPPPPPPTPPPPGDDTASSSSLSSDSDDGSDHPRGDPMEDVQRMIEKSITAAFAARDQAVATATATGTIPASFPSLPSSSTLPQHVLSRWPWVSEDVVKNIAAGTFEIDNLPKLHRSDELRNAYLKRSMKGGGIYQPLDGKPPEFIAGTSKLQSSFRDSATFFLAWHIYTSIRAEFKPEMGTRLAFWTETLQYFVHLGYPWSSILSYIIAYYQTYQNRDDAQAWFEPNATLMQLHLTLVHQPTAPSLPSAAAASTSTSTTAPWSARPRPQPSAAKLVSMSEEVCQNFNRVSGCTWSAIHGGSTCPRRHVCTRCLLVTHKLFNCPGRKAAAGT